MKWKACVLLLLAVGSPAWADPIPGGGQVVIAYLDQPSSLNPAITNFGIAPMVSWAFTNALFADNANEEDVPELVEKWDVSPDGLTWTFQLRHGVRFSDGTAMTARDIVASLNAEADPHLTSSNSVLSGILRSVSEDGPDAFKVILKTPYSLLPSFLQFPIVPWWAVEGTAAQKADYEKQPIGTGPFKITEWTSSHIALDANSHYFGERPHLGRILFRRYADRKLAWTAFMQGQVDVAFDVDYEDCAVIKDDPRFQTYEFLEGMCNSLLFNLRDPLLSQPGIREAICLAIDRRDLINTALKGGGVPTTGPFMPGTWAYNQDPALQPYDPERASRILAKLGWKDTNADWILEKGGKQLKFTAIINDVDPISEAAAKRLRWQLLQVGIRMDVEVLPVDPMVRERLLPGKFQAALVFENAFTNPDDVASAFWSSSAIGADNLSSYRNPEVDRLIEAGRAATDSQRKSEIYRQIHGLIAADVPAKFLYFRKRYMATSARIGGFAATNQGQFGFSMGSWYIKQSN